MTEDEIRAFVASMPGTAIQIPGPESGAPEIAWGDSFFYYDPDDESAARMHPFATLVTKDYPGFDTESRLDPPGAFRLNIAVGRDTYTELLGHRPAEHDQHHAGFDYAAADTLLPHPTYAGQGWVAIVNPGVRTADQVRALLDRAYALAVGRHQRRRA